MKRSIFAFALLGLVGCFLPLVPGLSWFDMRQLDQGWTVWLVLAAFAVPTLVAASTQDRGAALVAIGGFGYLTYKFGTGVYDLIVHASIGGTMMGIAIVGGLASAVFALIAPNQRR